MKFAILAGGATVVCAAAGIAIGLIAGWGTVALMTLVPLFYLSGAAAVTATVGIFVDG